MPPTKADGPPQTQVPVGAGGTLATANEAARAAAAAFAAGDAEAALRGVSLALDIVPGRPVWRLLRVRALVKLGRTEEASTEAGLLAADPALPAGVLAEVAAVEVGLGRPERAARLYAQAVAAAGEEAPPQWRVRWAAALSADGRPGEVIAVLAPALAAVGVAPELAARARALVLAASEAVGRAGIEAFAADDDVRGLSEIRRALALQAEHLEDGGELAAARLFGFARSRIPARLAEIARLYVDAGAKFRAPYTVVIDELDRQAAEARGLTALLANRREAEQVLRCALAALPGDAAQMLTYRLARVLAEVGDEAGMAALIDALALENPVRLSPRELAAIAGLVEGRTTATAFTGLIDRALERNPGDPMLLRAAARLAREDPVRQALLWPRLLMALEVTEDSDLAGEVGVAAFDLGEWEIAQRRCLASGERTGYYGYFWRAGVAALARGRDADASQAFSRMSPRLDKSALGALSATLPELRAAIERGYTLADDIDRAGLSANLAGSLDRLRARLEADGELTVGALLAAAEQLEQARRAPFRELAMVPSQFSYVQDFDSRYGTLDLAALGVVDRALLEHAAVLLDSAAGGLGGARAVGDRRALRDLPALLADSGLELGRPAWARAHLERLWRLAPGSGAVEWALERCALQEGKIGDVTARRGAREAAADFSVHPSACADDWHRLEELAPERRWEEPGLHGVLERVDPDGRLARLEHRLAPFHLDVTAVSGLELRGETIIGRSGAVLRPSEWHTDGRDYPRGPHVLSATQSGAVLRAVETEDVTEPVVVLAGADPVSTPNYYHWMMHQLTRAVWALQQGWLDGRRLVIPAESRSWMREALALAGIDDDRLILQPGGTSLRLADAWLVSGFEHPGKAMIEAVREALWQGAGVSSSSRASTRRLFLDRPAGGRRGVFEKDRLLDQVRGAGFEVVEPGRLGIAAQVRLLAEAGRVAGFDGAAMTNLMFARNGVPVLDLSCQLAFWPDFPGIACAFDQPYRYLLGKPAPECRSARALHEVPARYDAAVVQRELLQLTGRRVRGGPREWGDPAARLAEGRIMARDGRFGDLAGLCRELAPGRGDATVDGVLGDLLKLLIAGGDKAAITSIERTFFSRPRLAAGWNPHEVSLAYLEWLRRRAIDPDRRSGGRSEQRRYVDNLFALWPWLEDEVRLRHNLYRKAIQLLVDLGGHAQLEAVARELTPRSAADPRHEAALADLLRRTPWSSDTAAAIRFLDRLIEQARTSAGFTPPIAAAALAAMVRVGAAATTLPLLASLRGSFAAWREATLALGEAGAELLAHTNVERLAERVADFGALRAWLGRARSDDADTRRAAVRALNVLLAHVPGPELGALAEALYAADPGDAGAALSLARLRQAQGTPPARLEAMIAGVRAEGPEYDSAVAWLAHNFEIAGQYDASLRWLAARAAIAPLGQEALRTHARVSASLRRGGLPPGGGDLADAMASPPRPLKAELAPLYAVVNGDLTHRGGPPPAKLRAMMKTSLARLERRRVNIERLSPDTLLAAATGLAGIVNSHFREMSSYHANAPIVPGPKYGSLDPARYAIVCTALREHALWLSEAGLDAVLAGGPTPSLPTVCALASRLVGAALDLDRPNQCEPVLRRLACEGLPREFVDRLLELCALQRGDLAAARALTDAAAPSSDELHALKRFADWRAAEGLASRTLHTDAEVKTAFDYVDIDGRVHRAAHRARPSRIEVVEAAALRIRDTELVVGNRGAVIRPHPWHLRDAYGYPDPSPILIASALRGVRLAAPPNERTIDEPLLVLENFDALVYRNYYHWMLLILTRINSAMGAGLLTNRRLLLPADLSPWMKESLELIGLTDDRVLTYHAHEDLRLKDARLVSSVEYPGSTLIAALRERIWVGARVPSGRRDNGRLVWLSRRSQGRRGMANEAQVEAIAQEAGFEIVAPERMSIAEQVRLMAEARAVAGVVGASLTNLAFARPGTQVLGLAGEEENYPTFPDLCTFLDLPQRWLFGRVDPRAHWWAPDQRPFEVRVDIAARELQTLARRSLRPTAQGGSDGAEF